MKPSIPQLDSSREEVSQLIERIKKTDATNRAKIRQYEKELRHSSGSIMRSYIVQIDSLNTLNQKLTAPMQRQPVAKPLKAAASQSS